MEKQGNERVYIQSLQQEALAHCKKESKAIKGFIEYYETDAPTGVNNKGLLQTYLIVLRFSTLSFD